MPYIIILTGHPCSGKTSLAHTIRDRALTTQQQYIHNVVIVDEGIANPTINDEKYIAPICYASSTTEKVLRGSLKSAFDRAVAAAVHNETRMSNTCSNSNKTTNNTSTKTLIILDSTNYIKGYRYELYCISKAATSTYCVVWCLNDIQTVKEWNTKRRQRQTDDGDTSTSTGCYYSDEILDALILRYEPPDERNRWDQPLYRIDIRSSIVGQQQQQEQHDNSTINTSSKIKNEQQGNVHDKKDSSNIAQELLQQSLYNMHNLSDAISSSTSTGIARTSDDTKGKSQATTNASLPLKRSAFQKKKVSTSSGLSNTATTKTTVPLNNRTIALTAEALSSLNNSTINTMSSTNDDLIQEPKLDSSSQNKETIKHQQQRKNHRTMTTATTATTLIEVVDEFLISFLQNAVQLKEGTSTRQHQSIDTDILHIADTITQQLCNAIIDTVVNNSKTTTNTNGVTDLKKEGDVDQNDDDADRIAIPFMNKTWYINCTIEQRKYITTDVIHQIRIKYIQWIRKNPIQELTYRQSDQQQQQLDNKYELYISTKVIESFLSFIVTQIQQQ